MTARREQVARIAESVRSMAATGQTAPQDFAMDPSLTLPQIRILYMLASGPARIADVSQAQGMARPNASNMVERLVRKGLVERLSDPNDRCEGRLDIGPLGRWKGVPPVGCVTALTRLPTGLTKGSWVGGVLSVGRFFRRR